MSGATGGNTKNMTFIAGSVDDTCATQRGRGYYATVASGIFTFTLDRAYDSLVSFTATVMSADPDAGEASIPIVLTHSITDGTAGGTITVQCLDDGGAKETAFPTDVAWELHFMIVLEDDTTVYGYDAV